MTTPPTPPTDNLAAEGGPRSDMSEQDEIADAIRDSWHEGGFYGRADLAPGWLDGLATITADALADLLAARDRRVRGEALREAATWVAEGIGYPVEVTMPDHPMPDVLWDALVTHIHADAAGKWHGNTLDREDTESWLADEAGRADE